MIASFEKIVKSRKLKKKAMIDRELMVFKIKIVVKPRDAIKPLIIQKLFEINLIHSKIINNEAIIKKNVKYIPPLISEKSTTDKRTIDEKNLIFISLGRFIIYILFNTSKSSIPIFKIVYS